MAIPPPPPPGPPPPPAFKLGGGSSGGGGGGGEARNALLQSIQKGAKLKKTVTNDKSGPAIAGRVTGSANVNSSNSNNVNSSNSISNSSSNGRPGGGGGGIGGGMPNGGAKLGGIFEGMSSMPKLKPVNRGTNNAAPANRSPPRGAVPRDEPSPPPTSTQSSAVNGGGGGGGGSGGGALDFNAELTKHLTLKRQKQQNQQFNATEANLKTNRGPPPQPPPPKNPPPAEAPSYPGMNGKLEANSSSLFPNSINSSSNSSHNSNSSINSSIPKSPSPSSQLSSDSTTTTSEQPKWMNVTLKQTTVTTTATTSAAQKPQPNHGKPNLAPKPPGMQTPTTPNTPSLTVQNGGGGGPTAKVSRHHSMKTPRSPPVAPPIPGGPVFPSQNHFGTLRGPPQFQSTDAINSSSNGRPIGRPTVAPPPRPPANRPPPPPTRSVSNTNLPSMPLSTPTTNTLNANSSNNVSALKEQLKNHIGLPVGGSMNNVSSTTTTSSNSSPPPPPPPNNDKAVNGSGAVVPPPLPPHRTCPAPPPPNMNRQTSNTSNLSSGGGPPVPPQRHSSIRTTVNTLSTAPSPGMPHQHSSGKGMLASNGSVVNSVNRIIVDLEAKFSSQFHNVTDFPKPSPFLNSDKLYPSRNPRAKNVTENRKQRAPNPPKQPSQERQTAAPPPPPPPSRNQPPSQQADLGYESLLSQPGFIQLSDGKLFANESSSC